MRLVRYGPAGKEKPGLIDADGKLRDLSRKIRDIDGTTLGPAKLKELAKLDARRLPLVKGKPRLGPCVATPAKFVAIGLNYIDHAKETGSPIPEHPIVFFKSQTCIIGPNDNVMLPQNSVSTDWEVELGVVISRTARQVAEKDALKYVAGYCIVNDVSEREFQIERGGQWTKGKSADTFGPMGPWVVTADEVPDPGNLGLWTEVNGKRVQNSNTSDLIFGIDHIVSYVSHFMTLYPGDVIPTGTPSGVAMGFNPPKFLKAGDQMRLSVEGLGEQTQRLVAYPG